MTLAEQAAYQTNDVALVALDRAIDAMVADPNCKLRAYQAAAIIQVRDALARGVRRVMLAAPTGAGKTLLASTILSGFVAEELPGLFVVPRIELINQTYDKFKAENIIDIGIMQASHPLTNALRSIQVASIQTLRRRQLPNAAIVFLDEAHIWNDFYRTWMLDPNWRDVPFIGLSATPWRKGLGAYFEELIIVAGIQELIDEGFLSKFKVFAPAHPDLAGVHTVAGDYDEGELAVAMDKKPLVADIVTTWLKHSVGRPTLVFAVNRAHAKHIQEKFLEAGVCAGYIDCQTPELERKEVRNKFASGEFHVVCNVDVLTLGVDWDVRTIVLARPTKSEMRYVQTIGRGLRPAAGKDHCLILDHSDTTLRLGFVSDIHHEELNDGKIRERKPRDNIKLPKECPRCAYLRPAGTNKCPNCGFEARPVDKVWIVDGELHELNRTKQPIIDRADIYGQFKGLALERGYKSGFAYHKFKEYFGGEEPRGLSDVPPREPSRAIRNWVKSRFIAYAKMHPRISNATPSPHFSITQSSSSVPPGGFYQPEPQRTKRNRRRREVSDA
jgi:superfamily II DNA or RNA helicase